MPDTRIDAGDYVPFDFKIPRDRLPLIYGCGWLLAAYLMALLGLPGGQPLVGLFRVAFVMGAFALGSSCVTVGTLRLIERDPIRRK